MLLTVGSTVGAGIFFKNGTILGNTGSITLSLISWVIAAFAIFCIGMTLSEIIKKSGDANSMGTIGWIKTFCNTSIYRGFRNFMSCLYLPTTSWFMAFYATMSLQDSISVYTNFQIPWWVIITIAFFIMVYFYYLSIANKRVGVIQNNIMVFIKFIPILFSIFGGLIIYAYLGEPQNPVLKVCNAISSSDKPMTLTKLTPFLGVIASIPAIFFAFDGFYASSGLYSDLKDKKYFSTGISLGIIITAIVYLLISLGLLLGAKDGNITSVLSSMPTNVGKAISFIVEFCIFWAVLGIINGFAIYSGDFYKSLFKDKDTNKLLVYIKKKFNIEDRRMLALVITVFFAITFVLLTICGSFYFHNLYDSTEYYDRISKSIYQFCDIVSNWTSLIVFVGIGITLFCAIFKKVFNNKVLWLAVIAILIITISSVYEITSSFFNFGTAIDFQIKNPNTSLIEYLIPSILQIVFLFLLSGVCFAPYIKSKVLRKI